jgi:uncharacterized protein YkwD
VAPVIARVALLCAVVLATNCSSPIDPNADGGAPSPSRVSLELLDLTNRERRNAGLEPLRDDNRLRRAAELHVEQMTRLSLFDHVLGNAPYPRPEDRLSAAGYAWHAWGENLALGQRSAEEAVRMWMQSPEHRVFILSSVFGDLGTAYGTDAIGRTYFVQVFGKPR